MNEDLWVFATVVEQSSLNKASKLLNLSQPALSRKIAKLEEELGVVLFERKGKRLELTETGLAAYNYAVEQRSRHNEFMQSISRFKSPVRNIATVGASLTTIQTTLPPLIEALMDKYPDTELKLVTGKTHEIVSQVKENKLDLGVIASSISDPGLQCVPLFQDHLMLVVPRKHKLTRTGRAVVMEDLNELPMITFSKDTWYRRLVDNLFGKYAVNPDTRMEIDSFEAIVRLLPICKAAALLPRSYLRPQLLRDNELVSLPMKELGETRRATCLIYPLQPENGSQALEWAAEIKDLFRSSLSFPAEESLM
ncbi:LysR family transcriptional regulator [Paenibacillus physcomitrellae]|uniref:LysR family transcriptional regulator n=1 Tax=Paenibacillus physcomitrellae TaxID=1619311 RepID=A0ABQ1G3G2_9BACL|nr:LysR family transcriptional regulator [Paenibacillus physcomitrellae]GGA35596.1 LysR family transcriptional regulator [Paenibacillus physcomitrellae]